MVKARRHGSSSGRGAAVTLWLAITCSLLMLVAPLHSVGENLVPNPSVEQAGSDPQRPVDWHTLAGGDRPPSYQYRSGVAADGARSLAVVLAHNSNRDVGWYFREVAVVPGATYAFCHHYRATTGSVLVARYTTTGGTQREVYLKSLPASGTWVATTGTTTAPTDAARITLLHTISESGSLETDAFSLTLQQAPPTTPVGGPTTATPTPPQTPGAARALLSLTFDDAIQNQYLNAWPQLQAYGMRGTFYAPTGDLGNGFFMTASELRALHAAGNHIGSHTVSHARLTDLTDLTAQQVEYELAESKRYLECLLGVPVRDFASPYGAYNAAVLDQVRRHYRTHRSTLEGSHTTASLDPYLLRVRNVYSTTTEAEVAAWAQGAIANRTWVVLLYHGITENPDTYGTTPAMFGRHLAAIRNSGIPVVTVDQALTELQVP